MNRKIPKKTSQVEDDIFNKKLTESVWVQAQKTGNVLLANKSLNHFPNEIIKLQELNLSSSPQWWERSPVIKIDLSHNEIILLPPEVEVLNEFLKFFLISYNSLTSIPQQFSKLANLVKIDFSNNKLSKIDITFKDLVHLEDLNLSNNSLIVLPDIWYCNKLEKLDCSSNQIEVLPNELSNLYYLLQLQLHHNNIKNISGQLFTNWKKLKTIEIQYNKIEQLPSLTPLISLVRLDVRYNRLNQLPPVSSTLVIKELFFGFNQITKLEPLTFFQMKSLGYLELQNNQIDVLPIEITNLSNLETLDIRNNSIRTIPFEIGKMNLIKLMLEGNMIKVIPSDVLNKGTRFILDHLKNKLQDNSTLTSAITVNTSSSDIYRFMQGNSTINFTGQNLKEVPSTVFELNLSIITKLILTKNQLTVLPTNLVKLDNLVTLQIDCNKLTNLPNELSSCILLEDIDITSNNLTSFPLCILQLHKLKHLKLNNNRISEMPSELFAKLENLQTLQISNNQLRQIPDSIELATKLNELNLSSNKLSDLNPTSIIKCRSLATLDISNNDFTNLPAQLGLCTQLQNLKITGNPCKSLLRILDKPTSVILEFLRQRL